MPLRYEERTLAGALPEHESLGVSDRELLDVVGAFNTVASWRLDIETSHYWVSRNLYDIFGLTYTEGRANLLAFRDCVHPEDIDLLHDALDTSIERKCSFCLTYRIRETDGYKFIRTIGRFREKPDAQGAIIGVTYAVADPLRELIVGP